MDEVPILSADNEDRAVKLLLGCYDAPAYVRRARQVQHAFDQLLDRCRVQREEWLRMPRLLLGVLRDLAGDWAALARWLGASDLDALRRLEAEWSPRLRVPVERTTSARRLRRALSELVVCFDRFNARWTRFLPTVDLQSVNALVDGYNRYYLLEKECAFRSARLARQGFQKLAPVTEAWLLERLPLLPVPEFGEKQPGDSMRFK